MTRKMTQARLPATTRVVMAEVFRDIPVGTWGRVSHRTLARRLGFSESTISRGMELLVEHRFVDRRPRDDGPGYEICPLPPPELRPKPKIAAPADLPAQMPLGANFYPSTVDHVESITAEASGTPKNGAQVVALVDDPIFYDQTCSGGMHGAHAQNPKPDSPPELIEQASLSPSGNDLPPAPPPALARYFAPYQWRKLLSIAPAGYGLADLAGAVETLRTRTDTHRPFHLLCAAIERGEPIYSHEEIEAREAELRALTTPPAPPDEAPKKDRKAGYTKRRNDEPYDASKTDWAALNRAQDAKLGRAPAANEPSEAELLADLDEALRDDEESADPPPAVAPAPPPAPPAAPGQDLAALVAEAIALLADAPPDTVERGRISYLVRQERRSPAQVAETLRAERERRRRPKNRAPARRLVGGT
jgi:hypothetical protein